MINTKSLNLNKSELDILLSSLVLLTKTDQSRLDKICGSVSALYNKLYTVSEEL
jgi:hypothetical protein